MPNSQLGTVVEYKSGRKVLKTLGGIVYELMPGQQVKNYQEVVVLDQDSKLVQRVGKIENKIVAAVEME